jgi:putative transposase
MKRITPTERIGKMLEELLTKGTKEKEVDVRSLFIRLATQKLAQELLEAARTDFLGREHYERTDEFHGWRNGYEPTRLKTTEGEIPIEAPQVREASKPFRPPLLDFLRGNTEALERLAVEMYVRGLSTRDIEETLLKSTGERLLSRSGVSEVTEAAWEEFEAFQKRDLSGFELECLFLDAIYESLRLQGGPNEAILCAWGITRDGNKVLLHLTLGNKESYHDWLQMIRDMVRRGLRIPLSVTSDRAPGLVKAIEQMFPKSLPIHCWAHKMRNIVNKLPADAIPEVKSELAAIRDAPNYEVGLALANKVIDTYKTLYPSAIACLDDDLEASLNHLKLPVRIRKSARTTNLIERSFEEERRRSKVIPRFFSEKSCLKLVFAVLWRVSGRWQRIRLSKRDLEQIDQLRVSQGLPLYKSKATRLHSNRRRIRCER